jgi:hypothetical protein
MLGIMYENGGPVTLYVKGEVVIAKYGIRTLLEVEVVETVVARTNDGGVGGRTPPMTTTVAGISGFPEEETKFSSITIRFKYVKRSFNRGCSGVIFGDLVASKDPCWSSFHLSGGGGGSSVTSGRPRSLRDRWSL